MNKVKTVIIPIAGKGTRFLPITKSVTKTMFPIINKPVIQYLIEEAIICGINKFIFVIGKDQEIVKDYLDLKSNYYNSLTNDYDELSELDELIKEIEAEFVIQEEQLGLGHAIKCCKDIIDDKPFGVMLGDDLVLSKDKHYGLYDLIKNYELNPSHYLGIKEVDIKDTYKYGIVKLNNDQVIDIIEKPKDNPPSNYAVVGRYVFNPSIFKYLEKLQYVEDENGNIKELQLTDAISLALKNESVYATIFNGERFDIGNHAGYIEANIFASLDDDSVKDEIINYLNTLKK